MRLPRVNMTMKSAQFWLVVILFATVVTSFWTTLDQSRNVDANEKSISSQRTETAANRATVTTFIQNAATARANNSATAQSQQATITTIAGKR